MDRVCARQVRNLLLNLTVINFCMVSAATHLYAIDPARPDSWSALIQQADTFHVQLKLTDAERSGRQALAAANVAGVSDARLPLTYAVLASIYRDQGRCSDSRASYSRAIALYEKQVNPSPKYVFRAIAGVMDAACECDDFAAAQRLFSVYSAQLQKYRTGPSDDAWILEIQAGIARGQKHYAIAEQEFRRAIKLFWRKNEPGNLGDIVELRNNVALMVGRQGRLGEGLKELELAVSQMEAISPRFFTLAICIEQYWELTHPTGQYTRSQSGVPTCTCTRDRSIWRRQSPDGHDHAELCVPYCEPIKTNGPRHYRRRQRRRIGSPSGATPRPSTLGICRLHEELLKVADGIVTSLLRTTILTLSGGILRVGATGTQVSWKTGSNRCSLVLAAIERW